MTEFDPYERARETYELAYERVMLARQKWAAAGQPFTMEYRNHMVGQHPLFRALRQAEADAAARLEAVRVRHRGPAPKAVVQASIGESPASKLRVLK